jgi:hypothetical protein
MSETEFNNFEYQYFCARVMMNYWLKVEFFNFPVPAQHEIGVSYPILVGFSFRLNLLFTVMSKNCTQL